MKLLVDVFDALGNRLGDGPVQNVVSASVKRSLDGAGSIRLEFPAGDKRVQELIQNECRVIIYVQHDDNLRELGRGVIRNITVNGMERNTTLFAEGADSLDALKRRSTLLNRQFTNQPISNIVNSLVSLVPGWQAVVESQVQNDLQTARFDGTSVLKALIRVAEEKGLHIREGMEANTVEVGIFGAQTNIVITNVGSVPREVYSNNDVILIEKLTVTQDSEAVANWIVPLGAGEGQAALTLKNSDRLSPYSIEQIPGADGKPLYYLKDDASIAANDQIERIITFKNIAPLANSETGKRLAANALYDAAAAWLQRNSQRQVTYTVTGVKPRQKVRPGDKIRLIYKGVVYRDGEPVIPLDVDGYFYVLSVVEKVSDSGITIDLEISNVDKHAQDAAQVVVGALEAVDVRNMAVQTFPYTFENTYYDTLSDQKPARFRFKVTDYVTDIVSVKVQFRTYPLWTPVLWFNLSPPQFNWTIRTSPNHPSGITLWVNDVDVSSQVGGPWAVGVNTPVNVEADITDFIVNATAGLYHEHSIVLKSTLRVGNVEVFTPVVVNGEASSGMVEMGIYALGICQAILPT